MSESDNSSKKVLIFIILVIITITLLYLFDADDGTIRSGIKHFIRAILRAF